MVLIYSLGARSSSIRSGDKEWTLPDLPATFIPVWDYGYLTSCDMMSLITCLDKLPPRVPSRTYPILGSLRSMPPRVDTPLLTYKRHVT
jgi:hypothetical protein